MCASRHGFQRTCVMTVIYKFLNCGDFHLEFAWFRCQECGHEYLMVFSSTNGDNSAPPVTSEELLNKENGAYQCFERCSHRQWVFRIPNTVTDLFGYMRISQK